MGVLTRNSSRNESGITGNKSLFASFSSEKEESSFFEKKEAKKLLFLGLVSLWAVAFAEAL
jgi:hypothetical protein